MHHAALILSTLRSYCPRCARLIARKGRSSVGAMAVDVLRYEGKGSAVALLVLMLEGEV